MTIDVEDFLLIGFKKHSLLELQKQKWFNPIKTVCVMTCPDPACAKNPIGKCLFLKFSVTSGHGKVKRFLQISSHPCAPR